MYKSFYGLKENPFNVNPDPRFLYLTKQIEEALTGLMYGIQTRKGFITLTGEVGTGKTTLINRLLDWLHHRNARTAFLFNSRMNSNQLFDFVLAEFDIPCESKSKSQQLLKLNHWLLERYRLGETAVLIIDEAQNLTYPVLEEIRLLRQRIMLRCRTSTLSQEQTQEYITERLRIAGASGEVIFSSKAIETIHVYSLGIPRVINLLCEHSLVNAFVEHERPIQPKTVEEVAHEFQLDEVEPIAPPGGIKIDTEGYNSEAFLQNLSEALSRFRISPSTTRERK